MRQRAAGGVAPLQIIGGITQPKRWRARALVPAKSLEIFNVRRISFGVAGFFFRDDGCRSHVRAGGFHSQVSMVTETSVNMLLTP